MVSSSAAIATSLKAGSFGQQASLLTLKQQKKAAEGVVNLVTQSTDQVRANNANLKPGVGGNVNIRA